jgi:diadenosine tetraphosphate (Ap4A) HIT family hydrolase
MPVTAQRVNEQAGNKLAISIVLEQGQCTAERSMPLEHIHIHIVPTANHCSG